jgi:hypothetical protein
MIADTSLYVVLRLLQAHPAHAEALSRSQAANVMSFQFGAGQEVSILVSKNAGRYRLQADCFQAMWLVLQELSKRLTAHCAAAEGKPAAAVRSQGDAGGSGGTQQQQQQPFSITFEESLPLQVRLVLLYQVDSKNELRVVCSHSTPA